MSDQPIAAPPAAAQAPAAAADTRPEREAPEATDGPLAEKQVADEASQRTGFAATAASNPNRSRGHLGHQYSAQRQLFGDSLQDAVMGDKHVSTFYFGAADRKTLVYRKLSAEALDESLAFIAPRDYPRIAAFASARPLAVLTGQEGSGRAAAAVQVLSVQTGRQAIYVVHPDTDLAMLVEQPLPRGAGIVLADITARAAASLDEFALRRLVDHLTTSGQKLIVTAAAGLRWGGGAVTAHCVALEQPPSPADVVRAHFLRRFGSADQAAARALLDRRDVRDLIAARAAPGRPMKDAALLATLLADAAGAPESMAANAELGMTANTAGEIEDWFTRLAQQWPQDQCYAIALAVLNGLPNEKVADAGKRLEWLLGPETAERRDEQRQQPFGNGPKARLQRVRAIQVPRERSRAADDPHGLVVRYINRDYPRRLLSHVWEYDDERAALTRWLRELGANPLEEVHIGAGVAAAALAMGSFEHVLQAIVLPWARSGDIDQQDAAAVAVQTLGGDSRFAVRVAALLEEWSHPDEPVSIQATAARAYGGQFGAQRIDTAVRVLTGLAEVDRWPVTRAVARSLTELIATDTAGVTAKVLTLLGEWVSARGAQLRSTGRLVFLFAAADLVVQVSAPGAATVEWPAFLRLDRDPGYSPMIRYLWANALNSADLYQSAREVLTAWAKSLESNSPGREALARMLAGTATTDRTRLILHRLVSQWSGRDGSGPAPRAAASLAAISAY
jgi:hypothetical protein